jgi:hypothetical protein
LGLPLTCIRFANADFALLTAVRKLINGLDKTKPLHLDSTLSYDINCAYNVNIPGRFATMKEQGIISQDEHDALEPFLKHIVYIVPDLHVQGHQEGCLYLFGSAYTPGIGHFHGETAEHYWPSANQLGPQTTQMTNGHRQEVISTHHSDWNYKKQCGIRRFTQTPL